MTMECCDPCPWCGGEVTVEEFGGGDDYGFSHYCEAEGCGWWDYMGRDACPVCEDGVREAVPERAMCLETNRPEIKYPKYQTYTFCSDCTVRHKKMLDEYNQSVRTLELIGYELAYLAAEDGLDRESIEALWVKLVDQELGSAQVPTGIIYTARMVDRRENETRDNTPG